MALDAREQRILECDVVASIVHHIEAIARFLDEGSGLRSELFLLAADLRKCRTPVPCICLEARRCVGCDEAFPLEELWADPTEGHWCIGCGGTADVTYHCAECRAAPDEEED